MDFVPSGYPVHIRLPGRYDRVTYGVTFHYPVKMLGVLPPLPGVPRGLSYPVLTAGSLTVSHRLTRQTSGGHSCYPVISAVVET